MNHPAWLAPFIYCLTQVDLSNSEDEMEKREVGDFMLSVSYFSYLAKGHVNAGVQYYYKGVGEGGAAGACAPALSKVGGHKWV